MKRLTIEQLDEYHKKKYDYIQRVKEMYSNVAKSIGFWKLSKIKRVYPLGEINGN